MQFKTKMLTAVITILLLTGMKLEAQTNNEENTGSNFYEIQSSMEQYWDGVPIEERRGWKQYKRWENFWEERTYPGGEFYDATKIYHEVKQFDSWDKRNNSTLSSEWRSLGPVNEPDADDNKSGLGRVNCLRIHPDNPDELWAGASTGGVWKSTNGGKNWTNFDFSQFLSIGVNDIAFSESNPDVVYVATGDAFGLGHSAMQNYSIGVIKTTDGGNSWKVTNFSADIDNRLLIGRVIVHPQNENIVIAATSNGIFKSTDGGNNWNNTSTGTFFIDMEMHPGNSDILYASTFSWSGNGQIFKTTDNGDNWELVRSIPGAVRIALAVSPAAPDIVYALSARVNYNSFHSIQISDDAGENWFIVSDYTSNPNYLGRLFGEGNDALTGQGAYDLAIAVNPKKSNEVYIGGINIWKSISDGTSFSISSHWFGANGLPYVHADIHDLIYSKDGNTIYSTNDGGVDKSTNGGNSWTGISDGLVITQFYRMGASDQDPYFVIGGTQDNGTSILENGKWRNVLGGDGMECIIDPTNKSRVYGTLYYGDIRKSNDGGKNFFQSLSRNQTGENAAWIAPFVLDPSNPRNVYVGHQNIWKSTNYGSYGSYEAITDWNGSILRNLAVAPSSASTIYASSLTNLKKTTNGGNSWVDIMNSGTAITYIAVHPDDSDRIWVTKSGFSSNDKVWEFDGEEWKNISGNLPNVPVNSIVYQKDSPDRIYVATDVGVFYSDYNSAHWQRFGSGLPNVIVFELEINYTNNKLRAATYGRGLWETDLEFCNIEQPEVEVIGDTEFCDGGSVTLRLVGNYNDFEWSTGSKSNKITVTESGAYSVKISDPTGCEARSEAVFVTVYEVPELEITTANDKMLCMDGELSLRANFGMQDYEWSTGETSRMITVTEPGEYWVKAKTNEGCVVESEIFEVVYSIPDKPKIVQNGKKLYSTEATRYQWYYNDDKILGATDRIYEMKDGEDGEYIVQIFDDSECTEFSDAYNAIVSVNDLQKGEFVNIHPNPGDGVFNTDMRILRSNYISIEVTDMKGNTVYTSENISNDGIIRTNFDITEQPAGVYFVSVSGDDFKFVKKIIKK